MIRYLESRLALSFRSRLTHRALDAYMSDDTYYTVGNLDNRLSNADQCLTEDIDRFCTQLAYLHSHLTKPLFDIIYFTKLLGDSVGVKALVFAYGLVYGTGYIVRIFTPPFGAMVAKKAELEGDYRFLHRHVCVSSSFLLLDFRLLLLRVRAPLSSCSSSASSFFLAPLALARPPSAAVASG
jgi:ABC-type uncharacterized transport system fused permease/ATPase subunit